MTPNPTTRDPENTEQSETDPSPDTDDCYLCSQPAVEEAFMTYGSFGMPVGLCEGCHLREQTNVPTTIDPEGTWDHKKITYSDDSIAYTYMTNDGYFTIGRCPFFGIWEESGPFSEPNSHVMAGTTVEEVHPAAIPAVPGNTHPISSVAQLDNTDVDLVVTPSDPVAICPECGTKSRKTTSHEAWAMAKTHNENIHNGDAIAGAILSESE